MTAEFNRNLLVRINRELGTNIDVDSFQHKAFYSETLSRVEMHLVSTREQIIDIGDHRIQFMKGETIHTENSYKYSAEEFGALASRAGFVPRRIWTDTNELFNIYYLDTKERED